MKLNLNKWETWLIYTFIMLFTVALLYRFVISPGYRHMNSALFHVNSQQNLLEVKAGRIQRLRILTNKVQELEASMTKTNDLLFSKDEASDFLKLLPGMVDQTGSTLITMLPHDAKKVSLDTVAAISSEKGQGTPEANTDGSYIQMPVQITIRGEYDEIVDFFQQLREQKQLIDVSELDISTAPKTPTEVDAKLTLNLYVYENQEI